MTRSLGEIRVGNVEKHLQEVIRDDGVAHLTLFDPEKLSPFAAKRLAAEVKHAGTAAAMVGGSTATSIYELDGDGQSDQFFWTVYHPIP